MERETTINKSRVYLIGLSNGGMMALRALCAAPDIFAAAGSIAGPFLGSSCARPDWEHLHGAKDLVVPLRGGQSPGFKFLGVPKNWCECSFPDSTMEAARFGPDSVVVKVFSQGGHTWPALGDHSWNIDADVELWAFLSKHTLAKSR